MPISDVERERIAEIRRNSLADEDYGEIPIDTMFSLLGKIPWMCNLIDRLAAEQGGVVHSRWVQDDTYKDLAFCSACLGGDFSVSARKKLKYCPNCGARMDAGKREGE